MTPYLPLPTLFVPHGAPTFALHPGAAGAALAQLAGSLPRPRAILIISPHWVTRSPVVGTASQLETIHDFWGFPDALYQMRYRATGCPEAAQKVQLQLIQAGITVSNDPVRGLDHGAWVPLRLMFPDADIPVIPLSLPVDGGPAGAYALGQALAPLREQGFLIMGTGSLTHNLRDYQRIALAGGEPPAYVSAFADWLAEHLQSQQLDTLLQYRQHAPAAAQAHPTEEHLLPLFVALGAGGRGAQVKRVFAGISDYVIAMDAYRFDAPTQGVTP